MDPAFAWLDHLKTLASTDSVRLEAIGHAGLEELIELGLILKDDRPKQASLESRYEALQESHRHFLEARGCADRLQRRMAPRSRIAGLLPMSAPPRPGPDDPDVILLWDLLKQLKIQVRGVKEPEQVPAHLERIQEYLQVENRECLDRLADTDREIDLLLKQAPPGTLVEPQGFFTLTSLGEAALPEAPVIESFEAAVQAAFGPLNHRSASAAHFREDPASLLAYLLEGMARNGRPSALVSDYENLLEAFEHLAMYSEMRSTRAQISLLVRLLRGTRHEPKRAFLWCNRERLQSLSKRIHPLVPNPVVTSGWYLPYAVDLFLADGNFEGEEAELGQRILLFEAVQHIQSELLQDIRITDDQFVRLCLAITHSARTRNFSPGILMDRFVRQAYEALIEAAQAAPYGLGDRGTRLLFGAHLAHAAGFAKARLQPYLTAYNILQERLQDGGHGAIPTQALLHAFATLDRLERLGSPLPLETFAGVLARLHKRLNHHKVVGRLFHTEQALLGDEAALISNLAARVCFQGVVPPVTAKRHPDVGMAGIYESRDPARPPILGSPFGSLMLA